VSLTLTEFIKVLKNEIQLSREIKQGLITNKILYLAGLYNRGLQRTEEWQHRHLIHEEWRRVKSKALVEALRKATEEILLLATSIRIISKTIGLLIAKTRGIEVDEERTIALGLQG